MTPIEMYLIALIMGLIGGIVHQLHDSEEENRKTSMIRSIVFGAIAGLLTVAIYPIYSLGLLIVETFVTGWFGDSIILNIVRRYKR